MLLPSIMLYLVLLALPPVQAHPDELPAPGRFPACPDTDSIAIAYRDSVSNHPLRLLPESLLYGRLSFWPIAGSRKDCVSGRVDGTELFVDYTPIARSGEGTFDVDLREDLRGVLVTLKVHLIEPDGARRVIEKSVWTLDASIRSSGRRHLGERVEESQSVRAGPPDRLTITVIATGREDEYVTDLDRSEFSIRLEGIRIEDSALIDFIPPSPANALQILIAVDISSFLKPGGGQPGFTDEYPAFVDDVLLDGLDHLAAKVQGRTGRVDVALVRYAQSAQWLQDPFWRADRGFPTAQRDRFREFMLTPPSPSWAATGRADADATLDSMRRLWHYFPGNRAIIVLPRGREVFTGRGQPSFLPPDAEVARDSIEVVAGRIRMGEDSGVPNVFQHTERRYPVVYALPSATMFDDQGRGHDWIRKLAERTGGRWNYVSAHEERAAFLEILISAVDDLRNGYLMTFEVPNDSQEPRWKKIAVKTSRPATELRAPTMYKASGGICHYIWSYLITEDPITRLVAADEAALCWEDPRVPELLEFRLRTDGENRERNPLVREELRRSLLETRFRQIRSYRGRARRRTFDELMSFLERQPGAGGLEGSYRDIARLLISS